MTNEMFNLFNNYFDVFTSQDEVSAICAKNNSVNIVVGAPMSNTKATVVGVVVPNAEHICQWRDWVDGFFVALSNGRYGYNYNSDRIGLTFSALELLHDAIFMDGEDYGRKCRGL